MENKQIRIFQYEDTDEDMQLIPFVLEPLAKKFNIQIKSDSNKFILEALRAISNADYDLIIVDMVEQKTDEQHGFKILDYLLANEKTTPVWIYTGAIKTVPRETIIEKYPFVEQYINKTPTSASTVKQVFREFIETKGYLTEVFDLYDPDDVYLNADIASIGKLEFNTLLVRSKELLKLTSPEKLKIHGINSGLSGALIYRVEYLENSINKKYFLIKISRNKESITDESNKIALYENLPARLRLKYNKKQATDLNTENLAAMIIEYAEDTQTLFSFLKTSANPDAVVAVLKTLFFESSLAQFYQNNKSIETGKYTSILEKINETRQSYILKTIKELTPILDKVNQKNPNRFDRDLLQGIIFDKSYQKIRKETQNQQKNLILCHGDFHTKNILVSSENNPSIIDTGGITYGYWPSDVARLLVSIFIDGLGSDTYEYYSLDSIESDYIYGCNLINAENITLNAGDTINMGYITAINWLGKHTEHIYEGMYEKWEFQIALAVEFLQASYKSIYLPPGKRVLALLCACEAIRKANENI